MFPPSIRQAILTLANADDRIMDKERKALQELLDGEGKYIRTRTPSRVVRYREVADRLGISLPTVKALVNAGRLQGVQGVGKSYIGVTESSLLRYCP